MTTAPARMRIFSLNIILDRFQIFAFAISALNFLLSFILVLVSVLNILFHIYIFNTQGFYI